MMCVGWKGKFEIRDAESFEKFRRTEYLRIL